MFGIKENLNSYQCVIIWEMVLWILQAIAGYIDGGEGTVQLFDLVWM